MKLKLNSDYFDYYDAWFDLDAEHTLSRRMTDGPNKIEAFKLLNLMGIKTPKYGMVAELYKDLASQFYDGKEAIKKVGYDKVVELVVYTDINAHAGEGKIKVTLEEAREKYPGHFAVQYIPNDTRVFASRSERLLQIGSRRIWLEYTSADNWQSNCGDVNITLIPTDTTRTFKLRGIRLPFFAIDYVTNGHDRLAVDLNVSPGLKGTPVQQQLKAQEIVDLIKDRMVDIYNIPRF
jgi:hypothetical protein